MAAIIADLDGTTFGWGTDSFLPGAYDALKKFSDLGNQIVFVTQRSAWMEGFFPTEDTERFLKSLFPNCVVLFGITSPRILLNDAGSIAINHPSNAPWSYDFQAMIR